MESTKVRKNECQERTNNNYSCLRQKTHTHTHTQRATVKYKQRISNKIQTYLTSLELSGADENLGQKRADVTF